ncbi:YiiX/YebB-like N1pC/P60 family cysteine hydrolase [Neptuniibacter sp. 1_MG-2023]|uniref:YiiX/YebB-like N1pC/P60 family cysteine hydrolase n=1 Tax=Neptuniibacter sp. 1_MG-2023 TaxID=3062662 RepID=UPI0026E24C73|nr:YiiX/YebB-like N1pC/P60 family cysteine hydrolase [Neptuniibacter sp. 1_MG-2023]MDO6592261.1 YiiX/YebB-like N1pC/P60 family cysteine hydrolase [Neptuniibacter sp. 1_MG-2023]
MNTQQLDQLEKEITNKVKEGDIIFISIDSFLYRQVAKGTGSWTSHVGFIVQENNQWYVLESAVPKVTRCPLRKFLSRTTNNEVSVMRVKEGLNQEQIDKLKYAAEEKMGIYYHLGFKYDSKRQFCSKFVHHIFKEALGIEIGKVQTLEALLQENPQASVNFWRCWYLGFVPWQRKTITPASQLNDPQLKTVFSAC